MKVESNTAYGKLAILFAAAASFSAGSLTCGQEVTGGHLVRAVTADGQTIEGLLTSLDAADLVLTLPNGDDRQLPVSDLREVRRVTRHGGVEEITGEGFVLLANGDRLSGHVDAMDEQSLRISWTASATEPPLVLPLETVQAVVVQQVRDETVRQRQTRAWSLHAAAEDRLFLLSGATIGGELIALTDGVFRMKTSLGPVSTQQADVAAFAGNAELVSFPSHEGPYVHVQCSDGSAVSVEEARMAENQRLHGRALCGVDVAVPVARIVRLQFFGERVVSLPDLTPADYRFTPYLTESHSLVTNRNVHGGELRLNGVTYSRGLGVHSRSEITYDLNAAYREFQALVGIDDMAGPRGNATFAVEVDGRRLFEALSVTGRSQPIQVGPLSVSGGRQLKLIVDFGQFGNIQDIADWCDPVLIR